MSSPGCAPPVPLSPRASPAPKASSGTPIEGDAGELDRLMRVGGTFARMQVVSVTRAGEADSVAGALAGHPLAARLLPGRARRHKQSVAARRAGVRPFCWRRQIPAPVEIYSRAVRIDRVLIWLGVALLVVSAVLAAITWL